MDRVVAASLCGRPGAHPVLRDLPALTGLASRSRRRPGRVEGFSPQLANFVRPNLQPLEKPSILPGHLQKADEIATIMLA
jgi:hypothetical protein